MRLARFQSTLLGGAAICWLASPTQAQTQAPAAAGGETDSKPGIQEVVVTARKMSESVQDVPLAIDVLDAAALEQRGIVNVQSLQGQLPSIAIGEVNGIAQITSRGLGNDNFAPGSDPSVGLNVDGVVVSQPGAQLGAFFDLERVEVVRGPQGTLYGRNTTGGAINLVTRQPTADFSGYGTLTAGNYDTVTAEGAVSGPLAGDKVRGRLAFKVDNHSGYGQNLRTGEDIDDAERTAVRASLLFLPTDKLNIAISGEYTSEDDANYQIKYLEDSFPGASLPSLIPPGPQAGGSFATDRRDLNTDLDPLNDRETASAIATVSYLATDSLTFKSISGFRRYETRSLRDFDGTDAALAASAIPMQTDQYTQELQLAYASATLKVVGGLYYYKENLQSDIRIGADALGPTHLLTISQQGTVDTESVAGYANVTYYVTDELGLNAGGRWSWEKRSGDADFTQLGMVFPFHTEGSVTDFTPRLGLEWQPDQDVLFYTSYAEGRKSGVIASGSTTPILRPEEVEAYEVGVKSTLFGRTLRANVSLYRYDIDDLQVSRTLPGTTPGSFVSIFENAATARSQGAELELVWQPIYGLQVSSITGYSDATFQDFLTVNPLDGPTGVVKNQRGNRLVQTPEWSSTFGIEYRFDVGAGTLTANTQAQYQSRVYFTPFNDIRTSQEPVTRYDATLRFDPYDGQWHTTLWGRNLSDELVATTKFVIASGRFISGQYTPPLTYGVTVGYNF